MLSKKQVKDLLITLENIKSICHCIDLSRADMERRGTKAESSLYLGNYSSRSLDTEYYTALSSTLGHLINDLKTQHETLNNIVQGSEKDFKEFCARILEEATKWRGEFEDVQR